jgi:hypothetical protein
MNLPIDMLDTARALAAGDRAALASLDAEGWPYVSLVLVTQDAQGCPLLLLSDLAEHTKNIKRDGRASLLFDSTQDLVEPLAGPRLTVMGRVAPAAEPAALAHYVARHPAAEGWARMGDFHLYRLTPTRAHLVAGFGRIAWIEAAALCLPNN